MKSTYIVLSVFVLFVFFILFIGCGKSYVHPSPTPSALQIVSRTPSLNASNVASTDSISITFNNPVTIFDFSKITLAADHRASNTFTCEVSWSNSNKTVTFESIHWQGLASSTEAPIKVHILDTGAFEDASGQKLATGETLSSYSLIIEWWRYLPMFNNTVIEYYVSQESAGTPLTYEVNTIRNWVNPSINGYVSIEVFDIEADGNIKTSTGYAKVTSSEVLWIFASSAGTDPISYEGISFMQYPLSIGDTWSNYSSYYGVTVRVTVEAYENVDLSRFGLGIYPAYRACILVNNNIAQRSWFVYNRGLLKSIRYDGGSIDATNEAMSFKFLP